MKKIATILLGLLVLTACDNDKDKADAYGQFEADETLVSAEVNGKLLSFTAEEGTTLEADQQVGQIDTTQLYLKKGQLQASMEALQARMPNVASQIKVYDDQLEAAERDLKRAQNLLADKAATPKQVDDLQSQVAVLKSKKNASLMSLNDQNRSLVSEMNSLKFQLKQVEDQLQKSRIINPTKGTVLSNYVEVGELVQMGKPLYRIANLEQLTLRAYVSEDQLVNIKIGQEVTVRVDKPNDEFQNFKGMITWVSDESEFTPKVIQTREDRVNLVYAVKIKVKNDGQLKIGMPGEVLFNASDEQD